MRFVFVLIFGWGLCAPANAAPPDRISFHLGSVHVNAQQDFEEFNPGVFLTWDRRLSYSFGAYRNSYGDLSVAATVAFPVLQRPAYQMNFFVGWANYPGTGRTFRVHHGDVVPVAGLRILYRSVFVQVLPGDGNLADAIVSFGLTFPFQMP